MLFVCRIRSDHNEDKSAEILEKWLTVWSSAYHSVNAEVKPSPPTQLFDEEGPAHWSQVRYMHVIALREQALNFSKSVWADYVWVIGCMIRSFMAHLLHR